MNKAEKIPAGYKQTEIGVIPEDWDILRLNEISKIIDSLHQTPNFVEDGFAMVRVVDIKSGTLSLEGTLKVNEKVFQEYIKNYQPKQGDIVLSRVGSYGISSFVDTKEFFCMGQNTVVIIPNIDNKYLYYVLNSIIIRKQIEDSAFGSGYKSLSLKNIKELKLQLPKSKPEQTSIATVLSDTDALIEKLEKLIAKKKAIKQGAMQQLLTGKKRLPGFSGEWEVKTLGEIGKFKGGSGFPIKYQGKVESKYPFYKVSDMNNDGNQIFMRNSNNWIDESTKKIIGSNIFPEHTIIFAKIGAAIYLERKKILFMESCIDNNMMGFVFDEFQSDYRFLHYLFLSIQLGKLVSATALPSLNGKQIAELSFPFPRKKEQNAIAQVLSDMDSEVESLEQKRDKYTMLKQGMMQQLLTGKIRLIKKNYV